MLDKYITKMRRRGFDYAMIERYHNGSWMLVFTNGDTEVSGEGDTLAAAIEECEVCFAEGGYSA